ncbi:MAG: hypothetical protein JXM73_19935 [Anaerolineae bacterium]|nr:hypothetical protein [Anaerolineae bacterium]
MQVYLYFAAAANVVPECLLLDTFGGMIGSDALNTAHTLLPWGISSKDALHIACAIEAKVDYFITTDDLLIRRLHDLERIRVVGLLDFVKRMEDAL